MSVRARRITPQNFARFGRVVTTPRGEPTAQARQYKFWSDRAHYRIEGETEVVFRRSTPSQDVERRRIEPPARIIRE
jgi:hypothetical protein